MKTSVWLDDMMFMRTSLRHLRENSKRHLNAIIQIERIQWYHTSCYYEIFVNQSVHAKEVRMLTTVEQICLSIDHVNFFLCNSIFGVRMDFRWFLEIFIPYLLFQSVVLDWINVLRLQFSNLIVQNASKALKIKFFN